MAEPTGESSHVDLEELGDFEFPEHNGNILEQLTDPVLRQGMGDDMVTFIEDVIKNKPDVMVFLDRSARPAAWLFGDLWKELHPNEKPPEIKFINVGREKGDIDFHGRWERKSDQKSYVEFIKSHTKHVQRVRDIFTKDKLDETGTKTVPTNATYLDKKSVWLVDEYSPEGASLITARALFEEAFKGRLKGKLPEKTIFSFDHEPPWVYHPEKEEHIGVHEKTRNHYLTTPITPVPPNAMKFRNEMKTIAMETAARYKK